MSRSHAYLATGAVLVLVGSLMLLFNFGFATLSGDPYGDSSAEWWSAVLGSMFGPANGHDSITWLAMFVTGLYLCFLRSDAFRSSTHKLVGLAAAAMFLILLLWSMSREYVTSIESRRGPDGSTIEVEHYRNSFGATRRVETVRPGPAR